ncbi:MAG: polysaccharide biosynthesis/export family protein [Bacteroidales bacterium]|nr:polysaccharide biosynthesis/export family protein [Bacteroidales bacterium]MBR4817968.1 polysaccharide biosynthesis/export family protein [Bacteroidales bacterium]
MKNCFSLKSFIVISALASLLASCAAPTNISYFQDADRLGMSIPVTENHIRLRPEDKIAIIVNTSNDQLTNLFNLPYISQRLGGVSQSVSSNYSQAVSGYTLDEAGDIDFPVIGRIHVAGLTRPELAAYIKEELVSRNLVKDPVVTVEFMNLTIAVMGEVNRPGRYAIEKDKLTLLDALSMAGDLTIFGNRENVKVLRIVDGNQTSFKVNLCSGNSVVTSPVYYLQQDDVIYVEPNEMRARQSTVNGNNVRSTSFWISVASLAASVGTFLLRASSTK